MKKEAGGEGPALTLTSEMHLADILRRHLTTAKVGRELLLTADATSRRLVFHDLRGTGITWHAVAGTDPLKIQQWGWSHRLRDDAGLPSRPRMLSAVRGLGWSSLSYPRGQFLAGVFGRDPQTSMKIVDATGLEPVTPAV